MYIDLNDSIAVAGSDETGMFWRVDGIEDASQLMNGRYVFGSRVNVDEFPGHVSNLIIFGALSESILQLLLKKTFHSIVFTGCAIADREIRLLRSRRLRWLSFDRCDLSSVSDPHSLLSHSLFLTGCSSPPAASAIRCETLSLRFPNFMPGQDVFSECRQLFVYGGVESELLCERIAGSEQMEEVFLHDLTLQSTDLIRLLGTPRKRVSLGDSFVFFDASFSLGGLRSNVSSLRMGQAMVEAPALRAILAACPSLTSLDLPRVRLDRKLFEALRKLPLEELSLAKGSIEKSGKTIAG